MNAVGSRHQPWEMKASVEDGSALQSQDSFRLRAGMLEENRGDFCQQSGTMSSYAVNDVSGSGLLKMPMASRFGSGMNPAHITRCQLIRSYWQPNAWNAQTLIRSKQFAPEQNRLMGGEYVGHSGGLLGPGIPDPVFGDHLRCPYSATDHGKQATGLSAGTQFAQGINQAYLSRTGKRISYPPMPGSMYPGDGLKPPAPPLLRSPSEPMKSRSLDDFRGMVGPGWPYVTTRGTIALWINRFIMVEITCDSAIRVLNYQSNILLALDASGQSAAMVHPNGRVYQHNNRVEIMINESDGNNKYAKMWYKGVSFTSERSSLVYLVDEGGTRTTADRFSRQMSAPAFATSVVFLSGSCHGEVAFKECYEILKERFQHYSKGNTKVWTINDVRVVQSDEASLTVTRDSEDEEGAPVKRKLKTAVNSGTALLSTPMVHSTATLGRSTHLFVKRGEKRLHKDPTSFVVRNGGHSAGFDENGRLKVF